MHRQVSYKLDRFKDCFDSEGRKILAFTIRTTDGTDELYASKRAEAKGTNTTEELLRYSMVNYTVEGVEKPIDCAQPFEAMDKWSTKVRNFVVAAWKKLATPDDGDLADFFASATEIG